MISAGLKGVRHAARFIVCVLFAGLLPSVSLADSSVTLTWDASLDPTAAGYKIYYGVASRVYTNSIDVGNTTVTTIPNLVAGNTYYFAATTYNSSGLESDYSTETSYTLPPIVVNVPPTLNQPPDVTINENAGVQTVTLTGISAGSPAQSSQVLSVSAFSSNTGLVPNPTVGYTSPNSTATLTFTPTAYSFGSATITVLVDNGGAVSNTLIRAFTVNVLAVNQVPTLDALASMTIQENAGVQTVNLSGISPGISDSGQSVTVTASSGNPALIPDPLVSYAAPNSGGTLTFTPVANSYGWAKITVSVNDGQPTNNLLTRSFIVTVQQNDSTTTNANWTMWWQHTDGLSALWQMQSTNVTKVALVNAAPPGAGWRIAGQADFDGDGHTDLLWQHTDGTVGIWLMNGTNFLRAMRVDTAGPGWKIAGTGDLNGDGLADIVWQSTSGLTAVWLMDGTNRAQTSLLNAPSAGAGWTLVGTGDFNGDGKTDLLWRSTSGSTAVWVMNGTNCTGSFLLPVPRVDPSWKIVGVTDIYGDGNKEILWQSDAGGLAYWQMNTTNLVNVGWFSSTHVDPTWRVVGPR
jgi:hypothetical protein